MYSYFIGKIASINKKSVTIEINNIGHVVNVNNTHLFTKDEELKIFIYSQYSLTSKNFFIEEIYGFKNYMEKELFLNLMKCQGIGPKTSMHICSNDVGLIKDFIIKKDYENLSKLKAISPKHSKTIIDTLINHYIEGDSNTLPTSEIFSALKSLGYESEDIQYAISHVSLNEKEFDLSTILAQAIKLILNRNNELHQ